MAEESAYRALRATLTERLSREGVYVGTTSGYPRIEIHSVTENERLDKSGSLRNMTAVIEVMTTDSLVHAHELNNENLGIICNPPLDPSAHGYKLVGQVITQLQDLPETSDTQNTIYRMLQNIDFFLEKLPEPEPEPEQNPEPENESQTE